MAYPKGRKRCGVMYPFAKEDPTTGQESIVAVKCRKGVPCSVHMGHFNTGVSNDSQSTGTVGEDTGGTTNDSSSASGELAPTSS